ncbi:uncharacterized protein LOC134256035, partial [Saccostrea cucullata]|uniref:uncharacterized protein LOC134256035 n=1 Tax=Saccostrea cuccullata TaxID=36930 RepID=UPI002ED4A924
MLRKVIHCISLFVQISLTLGDYPFRNVSLPWSERVDDLVGRLTLDQIVQQLARGGAGEYGGPAPAIESLGIGPYQWNTECLRGDVEAGNATSFPQAIGLAAAFSKDLIYNISKAAATEVRAKHNDFVKRGIFTDHTGLSCFSPVVNIMRHPLWGRNQETYGEDPYLSGVYAHYFVQGLQGSNDRYIQANAGCKHFDAHGGPEDIPVSRMSFDAKVSIRDLRLTFLPAFKKCVEAGAYSLMCSYNRINGVPACSNDLLLLDILRGEWNFSGYVVSDEGAIENQITFHKYYNNSLDAAAGSVNAGCNLELSANLKDPVFMSIGDAVKSGKLEESVVRDRVKPLFYTRMRLGEFDPPEMNPYSTVNLSVIQSEEHRNLSLTAAAKSMVLLKRPSKFGREHLIGGFLAERMAVIGPMANNSDQMFGDYSPTTDPKFVKTPLKGLSELNFSMNYAAGCLDGTPCQNYSQEDVKTALVGADLVVVCLGTGKGLESENVDRKDMSLPGKQLQLLQDVVAMTDKVVYLLVFSAGPVNITWAEENERVLLIIQCFYPAQATGEVVKQALIMKDGRFNPAGRLPYTWYKYADQIPSMTDYSMTRRTYRYFTGVPLYPFGYGLSYSTFVYSKLYYVSKVKAGDPNVVQVRVFNEGPFDGDEVFQVYIKWLSTKERMPRLQLVAFERVFIKSLRYVDISIPIEAQSMAVWRDGVGFVIEPGKTQIYSKTTTSQTLISRIL